VRFKEEYEFYCSVLGSLIHIRSWNRLIADLDLEHCPWLNRRERVKAIAKIRKVKPKASADPLIADYCNALGSLRESIASNDGLSGHQIYDLVLRVRKVSFRQVQRWGEPHGLRLAATHRYQGDAAKKWIDVIITNASSVRSKKTNFEKIVEVSYEVN
jgi:hypothetical protein